MFLLQIRINKRLVWFRTIQAFWLLLNARICGKSTVNGKNDARYEARIFLIAEEEKRARKVLGSAEAAKRSVGNDVVGARGE